MFVTIYLACMQAHFCEYSSPYTNSSTYCTKKKKKISKNIPVFNSMLDDCNTAAANKAYVSYIASTVT